MIHCTCAEVKALRDTVCMTTESGDHSHIQRGSLLAKLHSHRAKTPSHTRVSYQDLVNLRMSSRTRVRFIPPVRVTGTSEILEDKDEE